MALAAQLKDQGNEEFRQGNYLKAAALYTKAIKEEPQNAVLYSNRAAALLKLNKLPKAWADAEQAMQLNPDWEKGYMRAAAVAEAQQRPEQALELYRSAQRVKPGCRELAGKVRSLCKSLGVATNGSGLISSAKAATDDASGRKSSKNAKAGSSSTAADTEAAAADQQQQKGAAKELWAGGHLPEAAELFQQQMLEYANTKVVREGTGFPPELHLLSGDGAETCIRAAAAFKNPSNYMEFVTMVREKTEELQAQAAVLLVPQAAVAFPQVWEKAGWAYQDAGGVLMQLQAPSQAALEARQASSAAGAPADNGTSSSSSGSSKYVKPAAGSLSPSSSGGADSPRQRSDQEARGSKAGSSGSKAAGANGYAASSQLCDRLWYLTDKGRDAWCIKEASCEFGILPQIIRT